MALKQSVKLNNGIEVLNSYVKVNTISVVKKNILSFCVVYSVDKETPQFNENSFECLYNIAGENPIKQAYTHLKTLPEFAGAIDC
jgi:hypothetical protein